MNNDEDIKNKDKLPQANEERLKPEDQINLGLVEEARQVAKEIREANEVTRQLIERKEKLEAVKILSGRSEAGEVTQEPDPEEEQRERLNKELKGLGLSI